MLKSLLTGACLLAALAGCASTPQKHAGTTAAASTTCLASGSRVPVGPGQCAAYGQSYSGEELRQTGHEENLARALATLDPSITVQH
jgi:hypothetical protein